jgi:hypothetical protein
LNRKWYRIRESESGRKEIIESDEQWAIEKGLDADFKHSFNYYFSVDGGWRIQRNIPYRFLFPDSQTLVAQGYPVEALAGVNEDELHATLQKVQHWVVFLEERLADCEMAIDYQLGNIKSLHEKKPDSYREKITACAQKIAVFRREHQDLVSRLAVEEEIEWRGMRRVADLMLGSDDKLIARFLDDAHN